MTEETTVYMAGSVHHAPDGGHGWRDWIEREYPNFEWLNPLDQYDANTENILIQRQNAPQGIGVAGDMKVVESAEIVEYDKELIDNSDAVLVGWDPDIPTCGTPMEVIYAWEDDVPVVVWHRSESGDASLTDISPWLDYHAEYITPVSENAIQYLQDNV